jgi:hypothetical protein
MRSRKTKGNNPVIHDDVGSKGIKFYEGSDKVIDHCHRKMSEAAFNL